MSKLYLITSLDLDNTYKDLSDLNNLSNKEYKKYVAEHGNVYTFEDYVLLSLKGLIQIPIDDNERENSISYRIL
ncbi:MAG: hypothetical protein IJ880_05430 [Bacilli bacterium]|nr:hypothetical protein [Bacilli bacterium]